MKKDEMYGESDTNSSSQMEAAESLLVVPEGSANEFADTAASKPVSPAAKRVRGTTDPPS